jgi:hypothetical protein
VHWAHGTRFSWNSTVRTEPAQEARAQSPLSFLAASFFSLKLKKSVEVPTMKCLLSLSQAANTLHISEVWVLR